jgi:Arc/MetJ-type ribon-helix-helix transcriptional regulator
MRQVLSLSLPPQTTKEIKQVAKQKGFPSVSAYVQYLFNTDQDVISKEELLEDIRIAEEEYKNGKCIIANSIREALELYDNQ